MKPDEIEDRARAIYQALASGGFEETRGLFADDLVWHVPGDNPVSGAYRGKDQYFDVMVDRMQPLDEWAFTVGDVVVNQKDRAALVAFHLKGERKGISIETEGFHMIRLNEEGRIIEGWGFTRDQDKLDEFFSA